MLVMIDNYDSFTFNLVQEMGKLGATIEVFRNDQITVDELEQLPIRGLIISPGPCTPRQAGISVDVIRRFSGRVPIFGVCLGHQSIGHAFGAEIIHAKQIMHGKVSEVEHNGKGLFKGLPNPFIGGRYHSLVIREDSLPEEFEIVARSCDDGEIMGIVHRELPIYGVQFHPESVLTPDGPKLMKNFLDLVG
ncbi:MAG: aminodeoxychorismate/anthranilate synthase component II [Lentisphaerae bacterium]|nr:MAG: aminodeoxychorismate/anthranilate synthase component II [Lentisphaerota bacterium]